MWICVSIFGVSAGDILAFYGSGLKCDQGPNICINFGTKVHGVLVCTIPYRLQRN